MDLLLDNCQAENGVFFEYVVFHSKQLLFALFYYLLFIFFVIYFTSKIFVESIMKKVLIYTDGACSGNPGPGGYGAILIYNGVEKQISGFEPETTNNRMELLSAINALSLLKEPCIVDLYSDSAYLVNAFNLGWIPNWIRNGWKIKSKEVKNQDLWLRLVELGKIHKVTYIKVKGHSDNEYNNACDKMARKEIENGKLL